MVADSSDTEHVDVDQFRGSAPADNPVSPFNVTVTVPEEINVRMVNASALSDYEMWVFMSSVLSNAVVGFGVAYFQAKDASSAIAPEVGWGTVVFGVLMAACIMRAIFVRVTLRRKGRN